MIATLICITAILSVASGIFVMIFGDWRKLALKFAAVSLSTLVSIFALLLILSKSPVDSCLATGALCDVYSFYQVVQNMAFVLFHLAVGRDAIKVRCRDRRNACWKVT